MNMKKTIVCLLAMAVVVLCQSLTACKDPEPEHVHNWIAGETTPATTHAEGQETEKCTTCGAIRVTKTLAKLPTEFPIIVEGFEDYPVIIKDGRANNTAGTQLDSAIIEKFDPLFEAVAGAGGEFDTIAPRGLTITVREGVEGGRYKPVSGNQLDMDFNFASTGNLSSGQNRSRFNTAMGNMLVLPYGE